MIRKIWVGILFVTIAQIVWSQNISANKIKLLVDTITANKSFNGVILIAEDGKPVYETAIGYRTYADKKSLKKTDRWQRQFQYDYKYIELHACLLVSIPAP